MERLYAAGALEVFYVRSDEEEPAGHLLPSSRRRIERSRCRRHLRETTTIGCGTTTWIGSA
jgi:hypothetical protein